MATIEEQLTLFESYFNQNDIWKANVLIKNIFNKNIDNLEVFQTFYQFSMKLANYNIDLPTRKTFFEQAMSAIHLFSENGPLTEVTIKMIQECEAEIEQLRTNIAQVEMIQRNRSLTEIQEEQKENLLKLTQYKYDIIKSVSEDSFQKILEQIALIEGKMEAEYLTAQDKELYEQLTSDYPKVINEQLNKFEKQKRQTYNDRAVEDFHYVYNEFKKSEEKYRNNPLVLETLVLNHLFSYDVEKLMNETLIYYNHVYAYLFGKLDEESKYRLTKLAIQADKV